MKKESEEVEEDDEVELKKLLVTKKDEDITIDAIPLATKLPVIIDYKLHNEGMMLQGIDREDLKALWRIVKAKYGDTRPKNDFERVLYGDLKKLQTDHQHELLLSTAVAYGIIAEKRGTEGLNDLPEVDKDF
ncbi:hypothetical protein Tco_0216263 [Tanacetum coccineum]